MPFKWCLVPQCKNTSVKTPEKLFVNVPRKANERKKWLQLARRDTNMSPTSQAYFCEDHFDLPTDMENYIQYGIMKSIGKIIRIRMKPNCLPTKFQCQPDRGKRIATATITQPVTMKRQQMAILQECKEQAESNIKLPQESLLDLTIEHTIKSEVTSDVECEQCEQAFVTSPIKQEIISISPYNVTLSKLVIKKENSDGDFAWHSREVLFCNCH